MILFPFDIANTWVAVTLFAIALYATIGLLYYLYLLRRSKHWKCVEGTVKQYNYMSGSIADGTPDKLDIEYEYLFEGRLFVNNVISLFNYGLPGLFVGADKSRIRRILKAAKYNEDILVYVSPKNPRSSCLIIKPEIGRIIILGIMIAILYLMVLFGN